MRAQVRRVLILSIAGLVAGCGGGSGSGPVVPPAGAPIVKILFPPGNALTDQAGVGVRGEASDADGVASVMVGGLLASTSNAFLDWNATLPVTTGDQSFVVDAVDGLGHAALPAAGPNLVRRGGPLVGYVTGLARDAGTGELRAVDVGTRSLFGMDPATGLGQVRSSNTGVGGGQPTGNPYGVAVHASSGAAYMTTGFGRILKVDPVTGDRTIVSGAGVGTGPAYSSPRGIALSSSGSTAYVANAGDASILVADLVSGDRTTLSGPGVGTGPALSSNIVGVALDEAGGRLFVVSNTPASVTSIDIATGSRTTVSGSGIGGGTTFAYPSDVVHHAALNRLYVADASRARVFSVDLATGDRSELSGAAKGAGPGLPSPTALAADLASGRIFVADSALAGVLSIDLVSGDRTIAYRPSIGNGPPLIALQAHALDLAHGRILAGLHDGASLVAIDAATGDRTPFATLGTPISDPIDVILDEGNDRALVIDLAAGGRVLAVSLATGVVSVVSGDGVGSGPAFIKVRKGALDAAAHRVLVVDESAFTLISVDLSTGTRSTVSGAGVGAGPVMGQPFSVAMDPDGAHALVLDFTSGKLLRVDLATGDRTELSSAGVGGGASMAPFSALSLHPDGTRVLGSDTGRVVSIDLATGDRTIVTKSSGTPLTGQGLLTTSWIYSLTSDPTGRVLWYGDYAGAALFAVDVATGDRVVVSR